MVTVLFYHENKIVLYGNFDCNVTYVTSERPTPFEDYKLANTWEGGYLIMQQMNHRRARAPNVISPLLFVQRIKLGAKYIQDQQLMEKA